MDTKLTLKLEKTIIEKAKAYAKNKNISLSKMIENYLKAIIEKKNQKNEITPLVDSLTGVINLQEEDFKKDYVDFLTEKYK